MPTDTMITRPAPHTMASPSWWGADSERHRLIPPDASPGQALFIKTMKPHALEYVDLPTSFGAATAAGLAGLGPLVMEADPSEACITMADLSETTKTATLQDFHDPSALEKLMDLRQAVGTLQVQNARTATVFDDIRTANERAIRWNAQLPGDLEWMLRILSTAEAAISASGYDLRFCHGDGNVSNILVSKGGDLQLLDWDCAARMDPLQDLGCVMAELTPFDPEARRLFELAWGSWDEALFNRARLYGTADAVRWGLIATYVDAADPGTFEYSKFSDWQFMRARTSLQDRRTDDRLRNL